MNINRCTKKYSQSIHNKVLNNNNNSINLGYSLNNLKY